MVESITNTNDILSKEEEKDRPSCLVLCCCVAAFFTATVCLLIGTVITCLKVFNSSYVDIFLPLNLIMFTILGITAFYLSLGIGFVWYNRRLRRCLKRLFKDILSSHLPRYSIERNYLFLNSPRSTSVINKATKEDTVSGVSNLKKRHNPKPKTMADIVSQEQLDEIFKPLIEDHFVRNRTFEKCHQTESDHERCLMSMFKEDTKSEQVFPSNLKRDLNLYNVNPNTAAEYETWVPKNSSVVWSRSIVSQPDTNYVSLTIPGTEACS